MFLNLFQIKMSVTKVIKSISDKRIYRPLSLQNNLECLVISDQDAQKSAAALSVGVGSLNDPKQAQGLAHYLEHMLFMGTGKYPEENEYNNVTIPLPSTSAKTPGRPMPTLPWKRPTTSFRLPTGPLMEPLTGSPVSSSIPSCWTLPPSDS